MITEIKTKVYAGRVKDQKILIQSSSGGAFTVLSDYFIEHGYAIIAAVYNYENNSTESFKTSVKNNFWGCLQITTLIYTKGGQHNELEAA